MSDATLHTESVPFQARCSGGLPSPYMSIATAKRAFNCSLHRCYKVLPDKPKNSIFYKG